MRQAAGVLVSFSLLWAAVVFGSSASAELRYPTRKQVRGVLAALDRQAPERRFASLSKLLDRLRFTESVADDKVMVFAFSQLTIKFHEKQYIEILGALDATPLDGGFAAALCSAYARMQDAPTFRSWYREHMKSLRRCVGESFNERNLAELESGENVVSPPAAKVIPR